MCEDKRVKDKIENRKERENGSLVRVIKREK